MAFLPKTSNFLANSVRNVAFMWKDWYLELDMTNESVVDHDVTGLLGEGRQERHAQAESASQRPAPEPHT